MLTHLFMQALFERSKAKSEFLHRERDTWGRRSEADWRTTETEAQLVEAQQKVAALCLVSKYPGYPTEGKIRHPVQPLKPHRRGPSKIDSLKAQTACQSLALRMTNSIQPQPCGEVSGKMVTSSGVPLPRLTPPPPRGVIESARPPWLTSALPEGHV
jgi:hypothetical protein